ncbi:MAG TPA: DMT family transporter [Anaerolineae bacterium]|nr:DMT family transporter [Anaerolineae bacterium]
MFDWGFGLLFGLAAAGAWGAGDFSGGLASKGESAWRVVWGSQLVGGIGLFLLALLVGEAWPSGRALWLGGLSGLAGGVGLLALYRGLAVGRMGVVAPLAAVVTAVVPVLFGMWREGWPSGGQWLGFGLALVAVWLVSGGDIWGDWGDWWWLPVVAGLGFGGFYILIDGFSEEAVYWPLVMARVASVLVVGGVIVGRGEVGWPSWRGAGLMGVVGLFDTSGNVFFALATRWGRLDVASILGSLYPAMTVMLAWIILGERLEKRQWWGVVMALVAIGLVAG